MPSPKYKLWKPEPSPAERFLDSQFREVGRHFPTRTSDGTVSLQAAARLLDVEPKVLLRWARKRLVPSKTVDGVRRFPLEALVALSEACETEGAVRLMRECKCAAHGCAQTGYRLTAVSDRGNA
jgi:hypothetical protein